MSVSIYAWTMTTVGLGVSSLEEAVRAACVLRDIPTEHWNENYDGKAVLALFDLVDALRDEAVAAMFGQRANVVVHGSWLARRGRGGVMVDINRAKAAAAAAAEAEAEAEAEEWVLRTLDGAVQAVMSREVGDFDASGPVEDFARADARLAVGVAVRAVAVAVLGVHRPMRWYQELCWDPDCEREHVELAGSGDLAHPDAWHWVCETCSGQDPEDVPNPTDWPCPTVALLDRLNAAAGGAPLEGILEMA